MGAIICLCYGQFFAISICGVGNYCNILKVFCSIFKISRFFFVGIYQNPSRGLHCLRNC